MRAGVTNFAGNSEKTCPGIFIRALEPIGVILRDWYWTQLK